MDNISADIEKVNRYIENQTAVITSDAVKNKQIIVEILENIDFSDSRLTQEFLERREKPFQKLGDFQTNINKMITAIKNDNNTFDFDITDMDCKLFLIAKILEGAIKSGCEDTAIAARVSLATGFLRIRKNLLVPKNRVSRMEFFNKSVDYLDKCYTYISVKNMIDILNVNLSQLRNSIDFEYKQIENTKDTLADMIRNTPALVDSISDVYDMTYSASGYKWNSEMVMLYEMIVQTMIAESNLKFKELRLGIEEKRMFYYKEVAANLNSFVTSVPIPEDVELMDKVQSIVSNTFREAEKVESDFKNLSDMMENFSSKIKSLSENSRQAYFVAEAYKNIEKKVDEQLEDKNNVN